LLKDELAECLKNPNHHNIEDLIHKISSGFHRSYQVLTILALAEQFLEGEAKDAALNTAKHYAGAAAKNAYQSRRKKEARLIVETFPLTKYMLDKLLAMANEKEDIEFATYILQNREAQTQGNGKRGKNRFSL
ncbi:MAG: hypothetical protein IIZ39_13040, partial [Blautia sp.]|nr:hypothetical protein [Blautia sp.]